MEACRQLSLPPRTLWVWSILTAVSLAIRGSNSNGTESNELRVIRRVVKDAAAELVGRCRTDISRTD
jgi:hypothetical protein